MSIRGQNDCNNKIQEGKKIQEQENLKVIKKPVFLNKPKNSKSNKRLIKNKSYSKKKYKETNSLWIQNKSVKKYIIDNLLNNTSPADDKTPPV